MNILVIGRAKTGTTAVSRAVAAALPRCRFVMEPKDEGFVAQPSLTPTERLLPWRRPRHLLAKIIFDHWRKRGDKLADLIAGRAGIAWSHVIFITRDPRDELISALHYWLYQHLVRDPDCDPSLIEQWIGRVEEKERHPSAISTLDLVREYDRLFRPRMRQRTVLPYSATDYREFLENWDQPHFVLHYEDFVSRKLDSLEKYLGFSPRWEHDGPEMRRVARTRSAGQWKQFFTREDLSAYRDAYGDRLELLGYCDWELEPVGSLDPDQHSGYLRRIRAEALREARSGNSP